MGATILDVTFYSSIQLTKGITKSESVALFSLFLCLASTIFLVFDIYKLVIPIKQLVVRRFKVREEGKNGLVSRSIMSPEVMFCVSGFRSSRSK
jgi:hypothetical protein